MEGFEWIAYGVPVYASPAVGNCRGSSHCPTHDAYHVATFEGCNATVDTTSQGTDPIADNGIWETCILTSCKFYSDLLLILRNTVWHFTHVLHRFGGPAAPCSDCKHTFLVISEVYPQYSESFLDRCTFTSVPARNPVRAAYADVYRTIETHISIKKCPSYMHWTSVAMSCWTFGSGLFSL